MSDDPFERLLREAASEYNAPPETPRELMWARIQSAREGSSDSDGRVSGVDDHLSGVDDRVSDSDTRAFDSGVRELRPRRAWSRPTLGLAAALVLGLALGRFSHVPGRADIDESHASAIGGEAGWVGGGEAPLAYRLAATRHLSETEALLTAFRHARDGSPVDADLASWARDLLIDTRLLLDSPAAGDARLGPLLGDLELLLVQIAHIADRPDADDEAGLIEDAFEQRDVLHRLRAIVPAGPVSGT